MSFELLPNDSKYASDDVRLMHGDCLELMKIKEQLPEAQKKLAEYKVIAECKPLAIGIFNELADGITHSKLSKSAVSKALRRHCMSKAYLTSVISSKHRYGVNGEVSGDVTESDIKYSKKFLNELK